ncbi:MAG: hypothetical protein IKS07_00585 [Lachnospiraceae bacterium]|nr:hypothetical protein [Lachnospiraceae bacterium]MCR5476739.1 hypothetical protein [Lachnospiraceae bacterium]
MAEITEQLIDEILRHLDSEVELGAAKMSVEMDDTQEEYAKVSHKCCRVYGKEATQVVAQIDMCQDLYLSQGLVE